MKLPYAEDLNYWKTGTSSSDTWMERTKKLITNWGGRVRAEAFGSQDKQAAFMLEFDLSSDRFKVVWPILPSRSGNERSAKIQAATMLHHDIKSRLVAASVLGPRRAFMNYLVLPNGQTAGEVSSPDLVNLLPGKTPSLPQSHVLSDKIL